MFLNYLKIAFKVLWRKKFFTAIGLFGISFTLMILTLMIAFIDNELGAKAPLTEGDKMLFVSSAAMSKEYITVTLEVDTTYENGEMILDTVTFDTDRESSISTSNPSYYLLNNHLRDLPFVDKYSFYSADNSQDIFVNGRKMTLQIAYTDAGYWGVYDFEFVEGGPFSERVIEDQQQVIIVTENTRKGYFGTDEPALGKEMKIGNKNYKVIGVVKQVSNSNSYIAADAFFPFTHFPSDVLNQKEFLGNFEAVFMVDNAANLDALKAEIASLEKNVPMPNPEEYDKLELTKMTLEERYARYLIYRDEPADSLNMFYLILIVMTALFILLPTLNLVNINITRIMERSSEIGVRKAFGAHTGNLLVQFLFENVVITFIGGLIGFLLSLLAIQWINSSGVFEKTILEFNIHVFFFGLLITFVFGIISGIAPAWKMSRVSIIKALKNI